MGILDAFLLQLAAFVGREKIFGTGVLLFPGANLMMQQQGLASVRPPPVRTPAGFHLNQTEINSKLDFLPAVSAHDLARLDLAGFMRRFAEQIVQVLIHYLIIETDAPFVNGVKAVQMQMRDWEIISA